MNKKITTEPAATEIGEQKSGSYFYLQFYLPRAAQNDYETIAKNLKQFEPWPKEHVANIEYYQLCKREPEAVIDSAKGSVMNVLDSISKTLPTAADDEEVWMKVENIRDQKCCENKYAKMIQDERIEPIGNEFLDLVTPEKRPATGEFSRNRE